LEGKNEGRKQGRERIVNKIKEIGRKENWFGEEE
jgi:hypothetical protein